MPKRSKKKGSKSKNEDTNPPPSNPPPPKSSPWSIIGIRFGPSKPAPRHPLPTPNVYEPKPLKLSTYEIDPTAAYEKKPGWASTAAASARLAIDLTKESSDVFTPLKSVASGLSAILKYYDQTAANRKSIESLIPRVDGLAKSLSTPAPEGEVKEIQRRQELKKKLDNALRDLGWLEEQGKIKSFVKNVEDADKLNGLAQDIRDAMMDYQTALQQDIYYKNHKIIDGVDRTLLNGMQHTADAGYLSGNRPGCLKGTRKEVLLDIERWLMDEGDRRVFWLNGLAGTGKSTIAQTFAEMCFADGKLGASFFCSRDFENRRNLGAIFPTLAFQLAHRYPQFRRQLVQVLDTNPDVAHESLSSQLEKVIIHPFKETGIPALIIIDALDECLDKEPASALLSMLSRQVHEIPHVKFLITGRPEPPIREGFRLESLQSITDVLKLHDVERTSVDEDIKLYLKTCLTDIRKSRRRCEFPTDWPYEYDIEFLCKKADGLFIYASTVIKFIASEYHIPTERMDVIVERSKDTTHEKGVDVLYTRILTLAFQDADPDDEEIYPRFRNVIGTVLLAVNPLSRKTLSNLVKSCGTLSQIDSALHFLHSVLNVPDSDDEPIRVFHKSFPDFLTDRKRCKDDRFYVDPAVHHEDILFSCLDLMKKRLKKNICDLDDYAVLGEVSDLSARREAYIGSSLEYACQFWTRHLEKVSGDGPHTDQVRKGIDEFFAKRLLCWVEVLSIMGQLGAATYAINNIRQWYISAGTPTYKQADDSERLVLEYFDAIRDSPSHIYHSALPLSPSSSWVRECYKAEIAGEVRVLVGLPDRWDSCSRTIPLQKNSSSLAHWGNTIAFNAGITPDVALLDTITGIRTSVLSGHRNYVVSLEFSLDGTLLISRSGDNTVNLWDLQTGAVIRSFGDDTDAVSAASISPNGITIALGTGRGTIHLWNIRTGKHHSFQTLLGGEISVIRFSPIDSQRFTSSSRNGTVQQWDIDGHRIGNSYRDAEETKNLTYSSNGTRFVSSGGRVATVRDSEDGALVVRLSAPSSDSLGLCCFSPDGRFVVGAASSSIYIWDITIPGARLVRRLDGHSEPVHFIAFSSSLISGSWDESVKFWPVSSLLGDSTTTDQVATLPGSTPIKSVKLYVKDGIFVTSDSGGVVEIWDLTTGRSKSSFPTPTPADALRDTHLAGDTLIVIWGGEKERRVHVWNVYEGRLLRNFPSDIHDATDLKISGDGSKLFISEVGSVLAMSIQTGGTVGRVQLDMFNPNRYNKFRIGVRGSKVGVGHRHAGWDFGNPNIPYLDPFPDQPRLDFVRPNTGHWMEKRWIEDTTTKQLVFCLPHRHARDDARVEWDGRYLLLLSPSGELTIVDFDGAHPLS